MVPQGTLFGNVRVEGRVVHTNCTASLLTGCREYDEDNDWSRPPERATIFELYRKGRGVVDTAAWAFVYAPILAKVGASTAAGYGGGYGANVVMPPTIPRATAEEIAVRMQAAAASGSVERELEAAAVGARMVRAESGISYAGLRSDAGRRFVERRFADWRAAETTTSHDAFLADGAIACMREFAPTFWWWRSARLIVRIMVLGRGTWRRFGGRMS